ncbi:MAG: hypothetical protein OXC19_17255 [Bryobacterales bacterium]|nr:hypothetical protein [Bryobacterales bacterium]
MKSSATPRFWAAYRKLPTDVRGLTRKAYRLFASNPRHQSLRFKKVHGGEAIYSVRVALGYRAVGLLEGDDITWFWIGTHADYDRLIARR